MKIKEACQTTGKPKNTIKSACQDGRIQAQKDPKGQWDINENSLKNYFSEPQSPDWYPLKIVANLFQIPENKLTSAIDSGTIQAQNHHKKWYIETKSMQNLVKKREKKEKLVEKKMNFVVKNNRGLHTRPSTVIVKMIQDYQIPSYEVSFKNTLGQKIVLKTPGVLDLLMKEIQKDQKVTIKCFGAESKLKGFFKELKNQISEGFGVNC